MLLDGELGLDFDVLYGYCGRGPVGDPESTAPRTDTTVYVRSELASTVPAGRGEIYAFFHVWSCVGFPTQIYTFSRRSTKIPPIDSTCRVNKQVQN